jgi:hypothetical protein
MATKIAVVKKKDPFAVVGEAMVAAADAVRKSTSDARHAASQAVPAVRSAVAQGVYVATYYTSFGVVFAALTVSRLTPLDNAFGYGLRDGASAARDATVRTNGRKVAAQPAARKKADARRTRGRGAKSPATPVAEAES